MKPYFYMDRHGSNDTERSFVLMCRISVSVGKQNGKYQYGHIVFSTGYAITLKQWDDDKKRVKKTHPNHDLINNEIDQIKSRLGEIHTKSKVNGTDLITDIRNAFKPNKKEPEQAKITPVEWIRDYIERKAVEISLLSYKTYMEKLAKFERFQTARGKTVEWQDFDTNLFEQWVGYMFNVENNTNNTVQKSLSTFKSFLFASEKAGMNPNPQFKEVNDAKFKAETDDIALTKEELTTLYYYDFSDHPRYEFVRDLFCFMCFTGLRISDLTNFGEKDIKTDANGNKYIDLVMEKTKSIVMIPLKENALEILEKYNNKLVLKSRGEHGRTIKEVCKKAGITLPVEKHKFQGGTKISETVPKYELVSNHTGRRTFATVLAVELGIPIQTISFLLGHSSTKQTEKYLKAHRLTQLKQATEHMQNFKF